MGGKTAEDIPLEGVAFRPAPLGEMGGASIEILDRASYLDLKIAPGGKLIRLNAVAQFTQALRHARGIIADA